MSEKAENKSEKAGAKKDERPKGPLDAFRDLVGQWERGVNQIANEAMGNEQFSRLMHGATSAAAGATPQCNRQTAHDRSNRAASRQPSSR